MAREQGQFSNYLMMCLNMSYSATSAHWQAIGELKSHEIDQWLSDRSLADVVNLLPRHANLSGQMKKIPINASQTLTFVTTSRQR